MTRKAIVAVLLCSLVSCSTVHRAKQDRDAAIPITFEAYPWRRNVVYDRDTIHTLLEGKCIYRQQFDASKGIPVSLIRERSYRFSKGKIRLPHDGYLKKTEWFRSVIMPDFYQRVGGLRYYLVRFDSDGHVESVIPQKAGGVLPDRVGANGVRLRLLTSLRPHAAMHFARPVIPVPLFPSRYSNTHGI